MAGGENNETVAPGDIKLSCAPRLYKRREPDSKKKRKEIFTSWYMVALHLVASIALAIAMIHGVDGYKALDGTSDARYTGGRFILRSSDVQTLIGYSATIVNSLIAGWSATVVIRCAFAELEGDGLTIKEFNGMFTWPNIPPLSLNGRRAVILLILGLTLPQSYMTPLVTGSVNWGSALEETGKTNVESGNPAANYNLWGWYGSQLQDRQAAVRKAAGMANLAWGKTSGSNSGATQTRCRHVVNDDRVPVNSTLSNVTMPCIVFNNISWPAVESVPALIDAVADNSSMISLSAPDDTGPFSFVNYPGNAVIFDQSNTTLRLPYADQLANKDYSPLDPPPMFPTPFMFSGKMTVIVLMGKDYIQSQTTDGFGYPRPNNSFTSDSSAWQNHFTYLEVHFTVGVMTSPSSTYISSQVVEGDQEPQAADIAAGRWVLEALYLLPDVVSTVAIMNTTSLDTWHNIFNYTENLIRFSYQGAWDMLQRNFDPNTTTLVATIQDRRGQATVTLVRVYAWLAVSILMTVGAVVLWHLIRHCDRNIVVDGPLALLLSDPTEVFGGVDETVRIPKENHHLSNLTVLTKDDENILLRLEEVEAEPSGKTGVFRLRKGARHKEGQGGDVARNCGA
ncbi:hypothetical protein DL767_002345 [Monosporascus sp. MG133]|nr:hypothetical protein DL767_002345 [Monosporascus sp. MG133]